MLHGVVCSVVCGHSHLRHEEGEESVQWTDSAI